LILVAIGLDILFGRRSPILGALIGIGIAAAVVALLFFAPALDLRLPAAELQHFQFEEPIGNAEAAHIDLDLNRYPTHVMALRASENLFEADIDSVADVIFRATGGDEKRVSLDSAPTPSFDFDWLDPQLQGARWDIGLSPSVPLELVIDVGSGSTNLDLQDLELTYFSINGGSGSTDLSLPASPFPYDAIIDGGSGSFDIRIDSEAEIDAMLDVGSGSFDVLIGSDVDLTVRIDGGSGSIDIDLPSRAGVQLVVRSSGSGGVRVPSGYSMVDDLNDDDRDTGIWESPEYRESDHVVELIFDPGSGSLTLR
jgi:hypothetical protein